VFNWCHITNHQKPTRSNSIVNYPDSKPWIFQINIINQKMSVFSAFGGDGIPPFLKIWVIFLKNRQKNGNCLRFPRWLDISRTECALLQQFQSTLAKFRKSFGLQKTKTDFFINFKVVRHIQSKKPIRFKLLFGVFNKNFALLAKCQV